MATTADFKNGLCIEYNDDLYSIVQFQHVKPGKGPAFVRTKLRNLTSGRVIENTFTSGVKVNIANVERRPYQFIYKDDDHFHLMHKDTFEQISIDHNLIEHPEFLKEGAEVEVVYHVDTDRPITCELQPFIVLEVTYSEPGLRGDTSSSTALKPATLETGATIQVPLFVNTGDKIKVDTRTGEYSERYRE